MGSSSLTPSILIGGNEIESLQQMPKTTGLVILGQSRFTLQQPRLLEKGVLKFYPFVLSRDAVLSSIGVFITQTNGIGTVDVSIYSNITSETFGDMPNQVIYDGSGIDISETGECVKNISSGQVLTQGKLYWASIFLSLDAGDGVKIFQTDPYNVPYISLDIDGIFHEEQPGYPAYTEYAAYSVIGYFFNDTITEKPSQIQESDSVYLLPISSATTDIDGAQSCVPMIVSIEQL